ncbi:MAG: segregation/condensation protein A [Bdellovibrionota bacterium]
MTNLHVEIDRFSGPMALLLHLIRQQEMDIFDINIHEITAKYLESVKQMKKLNLEGAGEFIAMAATLIQIKSKMLLPQYNEEGEVVETEDPRRDLVRRLIEYQMYQEAGQKMYQMPLLNRDVWARAEAEKIETPDSEIIIEEDNALYALIAAYRAAMKNMKKAVHKVGEAMQSIRERIWELKDQLVVGREARFFELVETGSRAGDRKAQLLITFLSLLELGKMNFVALFQAENFADIHVEPKKNIDKDVMSKVEDYESAQKLSLGAGEANPTVSTQVEFNMQDENWDEEPTHATETQVAAGLLHTPAPVDDATLDAMIESEIGAEDDSIENYESVTEAASADAVPQIAEVPTEESASDDDILAEELKIEQEDSENGEEETSV